MNLQKIERVIARFAPSLVESLISEFFGGVVHYSEDGTLGASSSLPNGHTVVPANELYLLITRQQEQIKQLQNTLSLITKTQAAETAPKTGFDVDYFSQDNNLPGGLDVGESTVSVGTTQSQEENSAVTDTQDTQLNLENLHAATGVETLSEGEPVPIPAQQEEETEESSTSAQSTDDGSPALMENADNAENH